MGNSGIRKLFFCDNPVETSLNSIYDAKLLTINLDEISLKEYEGQKLLIVNVGSDSKNTDEQLAYLRSLAIPVILFPSNDFKNQPQDYDYIKEKFKGFKIAQKVEINGPYTHPIYKFLKRNTPLYDMQLANGKLIREDYSKFLIDGQKVQFYKANEKISL